MGRGAPNHSRLLPRNKLTAQGDLPEDGPSSSGSWLSMATSSETALSTPASAVPQMGSLLLSARGQMSDMRQGCSERGELPCRPGGSSGIQGTALNWPRGGAGCGESQPQEQRGKERWGKANSRGGWEHRKRGRKVDDVPGGINHNDAVFIPEVLLSIYECPPCAGPGTTRLALPMSLLEVPKSQAWGEVPLRANWELRGGQPHGATLMWV